MILTLSVAVNAASDTRVYLQVPVNILLLRRTLEGDVLPSAKADWHRSLRSNVLAPCSSGKQSSSIVLFVVSSRLVFLYPPLSSLLCSTDVFSSEARIIPFGR